MLHLAFTVAPILFAALALPTGAVGTAAAAPLSPQEAPAAASTSAQLDVGPPPQIGDTSAMDAELVAFLNERIAAVSADPTSAEARADLGIAYEGNTIWTLAEDAYGQAIELAPDATQWRFRRGVVRFYNGDADGALADLAAAAEAYKNTPVVQARHGDVLRLVGQLEEAEAAWRQAIAAEQKQPQPIEYGASRVGLAQTLLELERPEEAIELCRKALELQPTDAHAHHTLGIALRDVGQLDEAAVELAAGRGAFPSFPPDPHGQKLADAARGHNRRMMVIENMVAAGNLPEAQTRIATILEERPDDVMVLNLSARIALRQGDVDAARRQLDKSLAVNPDNPDTLIEACLVDLEQANQLVNSIVLAQQEAQMRQAQGQSVDTSAIEAQAQTGREVTARAIERATKAALAAPTVGRNYFWLGVAQRVSANFTANDQERGQLLQAAVGSLQNASRLGCTEPTFNQQIATLYMQTGNQRAALKHAERHLALVPKDPAALWLVIQSLVNNERTPDIVPYTERLEELATANPNLWQQVVTAYLTAGDFDKTERALGEFEKAFAGTPAAGEFVTLVQERVDQGRAAAQTPEAASGDDGDDGDSDESDG